MRGVGVSAAIERREVPADLVEATPGAWGMWLLASPFLVFAVSYTHLRAHETVLDLVCRLLLEKKILKTHIVDDQQLL